MHVCTVAPVLDSTDIELHTTYNIMQGYIIIYYAIRIYVEKSQLRLNKERDLSYEEDPK
jgi:hypothetical protein